MFFSKQYSTPYYSTTGAKVAAIWKYRGIKPSPEYIGHRDKIDVAAQGNNDSCQKQSLPDQHNAHPAHSSLAKKVLLCQWPATGRASSEQSARRISQYLQR